MKKLCAFVVMLCLSHGMQAMQRALAFPKFTPNVTSQHALPTQNVPPYFTSLSRFNLSSFTPVAKTADLKSFDDNPIMNIRTMHTPRYNHQLISGMLYKHNQKDIEKLEKNLRNSPVADLLLHHGWVDVKALLNEAKVPFLSSDKQHMVNCVMELPVAEYPGHIVGKLVYIWYFFMVNGYITVDRLQSLYSWALEQRIAKETWHYALPYLHLLFPDATAERLDQDIMNLMNYHLGLTLGNKSLVIDDKDLSYLLSLMAGLKKIDSKKAYSLIDHFCFMTYHDDYLMQRIAVLLLHTDSFRGAFEKTLLSDERMVEYIHDQTYNHAT